MYAGCGGFDRFVVETEEEKDSRDRHRRDGEKGLKCYDRPSGCSLFIAVSLFLTPEMALCVSTLRATRNQRQTVYLNTHLANKAGF